MAELQTGSQLEVHVYKADGSPYRTWTARVERVEPGLIVTWSPPGHVVRGRDEVTWATPLDAGGEVTPRGWTSKWGILTFYWLDRPYSLLEVYSAAGELHELYVHVASRPTLDGQVLSWTDHELDVVMHSGAEPELLDEDEFAEAAITYGYTPEFQAACRRIAAEAEALVRRWAPHGAMRE